MSKLIIPLCTMILFSIGGFSQKKDISPGEFAIQKGLELRSVTYKKDDVQILEKIQSIKDHLAAQDSLRSVDYGRAYNYLATLYSYLENQPDSTNYYSKRAFEKHPEWFCKEVIPWQMKSESADLVGKTLPYYLGDSEKKLYGLMRKFCIQQKWLEIPEEKPENEDYLASLNEIEENAKVEQKAFGEVDWELRNKKDEENRIQLDKLYQQYGFPSRKLVTHDGLILAFKVLQSSIDCEWNKKWIPRFMDHYKEFDSPDIVLNMFAGNFDKEDGKCKDQNAFVEDLVEDLEPKIVNAMKLSEFLE